MILFFYGPNSWAARQKVRELVERFKKTGNVDFGLERIDGSEISADQVVGAITSLPFLVKNRLVIVEELLGNKVAAETVIENLGRVPESNVVVFYERQPDERTKVFKTLKGIAQTAKFEHLSPPKLRLWVQKIAKEQGGSIDGYTADVLINRVGADEWRLYHEIGKLVNLSPEITAASIEQLVEPSFQETIFDLVEALHHGRVSEALNLYQGLRATKQQPLYILSMISWGLRNLLIAQAATIEEPKPTLNQIASVFSVSPFVVGKSLQAVAGLDGETLKQAHHEVMETDQKIKSTGLDPDLLLEQLIISLSLRLKPTT